MGRGRLPMELIEKEKARKTTLEKRKKGLMKKVNEFSILCGVDVCAIIYAPEAEGKGQGIVEAETWPKDRREVKRIIQKYYNTTSVRRPKIFDVEEYYNQRLKKVEAEISKVRREMAKVKYPILDDSFRGFQEEEIKIFVSMLDAKIDACNQKLNNMLKGGDKSIELDKVDDPKHVFTTYPYFNLMQNNNNMSQPQLSSSIWPFQLGHISQPPSSSSSMLQFGQNHWTNQVDGNYDCNIGMIKELDGAENYQNCYNNRNTETMLQSYPRLPYQNYHYEESAFQPLPNLQHQQFHTLSNLPPEFQLDGFYEPYNIQLHPRFQGGK